MAESRKRDNYMDAVKVVGILSVVIGHAFNTENFYSDAAEMVRRFVYLYHLPIFFFCAGSFYRFRKADSFFLKLIKNTICPLWQSTFFIALYPLWVHLRVFNSETWGDRSHLIKVLIYKNDPGVFTGAMWFLPFLCVSLLIYYLSDYASRKSFEFRNEVPLQG